MSRPPAAPVYPVYPPSPAVPPPQKKKKRGCCSCCLWVVIVLVILSVSFVVAAQFIMRKTPNPVKEEYDSIPDYFSRLTPGITTNHTNHTNGSIHDPQSAIRNPQSGINHEPHEPHERIHPRSAIRNSEWSGGGHV